MEKIIDFESFNEDTSATGGPAGAVSGGGYVNSQPSALPGTTVDPNFSNTGGKTGDYISTPFNAGGKLTKLDSPMGKEHGAMTGKKSRKPRLDLKHLKDIFSRRQDYTAGEGEVKREPKVMSFQDFEKDDINRIKK
jgi:hypothetical protein